MIMEKIQERDHISQGTVIYGIRSTKYPEISCYAVIISARCDIANRKISKVYYLTAAVASEWCCTKNGFDQIYEDKRKQDKRNMRDRLGKHQINLEVLDTFSLDEAEKVISSNVAKLREEEKIFDAYKKYCKIKDCSKIETRKEILRENGKEMVQFLSDISSGKRYHYFFVPQRMYQSNGSMDDGLIVDLQEIGMISMEDCDTIKTPGIDFQRLSEIKEEDEQSRLKKAYWLNGNDDFVSIEGNIISPWCELLMQRFSSDFIRIGVDASTKNNFEKLVGGI